jgi:hypothetical protein
MKSKKLLIAFTACSIAVGFTACKKNSTDSSAADTTSLSQNMAISDNISDDANNSMVAASANNGTTGARPTNITTFPYCYSSASIADTLTGGFGGYSKVIRLTFNGNACQSGVVRAGYITIIITDSLRKAGSTATLIFNNYYVNGYHREGTIVWTNTRPSPSANPQWTRVDSGKVTAPNSKYWYVTGSRSVEETAPYEFTVQSGTRTVTNSDGKSATATVLVPLVVEAGCPFIEEGKLSITGPLGNTVVIDYSANLTGSVLSPTAVTHNGGCDNVATYSLNGGTEWPFYLVH